MKPRIAYKERIPAQMAVLSGELDTQFDTWSALPHHSGKLALAVTAAQTHAAAARRADHGRGRLRGLQRHTG